MLQSFRMAVCANTLLFLAEAGGGVVVVGGGWWWAVLCTRCGVKRVDLSLGSIGSSRDLGQVT